MTSDYCAPHGARMPHYASDGAPCAPDSPEAQAAYRAAMETPPMDYTSEQHIAEDGPRESCVGCVAEAFRIVREMATYLDGLTLEALTDLYGGDLAAHMADAQAWAVQDA